MSLTMATGPSIGPVFFDAVFKTAHSSTVTVTSQPVQTGANIADHAYLEPDEVTMEIGMTDAAFDAVQNHSVNAYQMLRSVMEEREPISLYTRLKSYTDMLIVSLGVEDDYTTANALRATVVLQKMLMADVAAVQVQRAVSSSKSGGATKNKNETKQKDQNADPSVLLQIGSAAADTAKTAAAAVSTKSVTNVSTAIKNALSKVLSLFGS